jgi:Fe2+ or Zn2+ uptake regulation protein
VTPDRDTSSAARAAVGAVPSATVRNAPAPSALERRRLLEDRVPDPLRDAVATRLRRSGQRLTGNRAVLVEVLRSTSRPLTIPEILAEQPGLAQSSVYRNLVVLEQARVVHRVVTGDEHGRFELAEDLTGAHHHHVICSSCGAVEDVPAQAGLEAVLRRAADQVHATTGFRTEHHRVDLVGVCRACA